MSGDGHRIALIENDRSVRRRLRRVLMMSGFDVDSFASSLDFLEALQCPLPDCIVFDLALSGMSGMQLQRELLRCGLAFPTIAVSDHDEPALEAECRSAGVAACLHGPLAEDRLIAAIQAALAQNIAWH